MSDGLHDFLSQHPLGQADMDSEAICARFGSTVDWEERYRALIQLGKLLPVIPPEWRGAEQELPGCESQVWLLAMQGADGHWHFAADSQARIVRGLLAVVLAALNHRSTQHILSFDMERYFDTLQLTKHLSPSRGNGLRAMVTAIRARVQATEE